MGRNLIRKGLIFVAAMLAAPAAAQAATTITVNTEADNPSLVGECSGVPLDCSLRQAIDKAVNGDTIALPAGHYTVGSQLAIGNAITIAGTGNPVVDGGHAGRVFRINGDVSVSGVTVTGGNTTDSEGGAGFAVIGTLTLTNSTVTDNDAPAGAGVSLVNFESPATARIIGSTVNNNRAAAQGGGIAVRSGDLTLINSTVTGNSAGDQQNDGLGGGVYYSGFSEHIYNSTIVGNTATGTTADGGNLYERPDVVAFAAKRGFSVDYLIQNTIVADGTAPNGPNCGGTPPTSQGNNLVNTLGECGTSSGNNDVSGSPGIAGLGNYGGPTLTRKLLPGSKAIDNGN